jgi:spermidine/putrescine-binding protein
MKKNVLKKFVPALCVTALLFALVPAFASCTPRDEVLKIYSWDEYIDEAFIDADESVNAFKQ